MTTPFTPETFTPVDRFTREVQIHREEFLRQLPGAIEDRPYEVSGDLITVQAGDGTMAILMTDLGARQVGSMMLPMMRLDFAFEGVSDADIDDLMDVYDQRTPRSGGA